MSTTRRNRLSSRSKQEQGISWFADATKSGYRTGVALSPAPVRDALALRFEVFNRELHEGLKESWSTGLDQDPFDRQMTHLILWHVKTQRIVGTYRVQTCQAARSGIGFYSEREFDLSPLEPILPQALECGRACIHRSHRNPRALAALWNGLGQYADSMNCRWFFGCCSLTSQDPEDGFAARRQAIGAGWTDERWHVRPRPEFDCGRFSLRGRKMHLPRLFSAYVRIGARIVSDPAIDREFGTVDFLVVFDKNKLRLGNFRGPWTRG